MSDTDEKLLLLGLLVLTFLWAAAEIAKKYS